MYNYVYNYVSNYVYNYVSKHFLKTCNKIRQGWASKIWEKIWGQFHKFLSEKNNITIFDFCIISIFSFCKYFRNSKILKKMSSLRSRKYYFYLIFLLSYYINYCFCFCLLMHFEKSVSNFAKTRQCVFKENDLNTCHQLWFPLSLYSSNPRPKTKIQICEFLKI